MKNQGVFILVVFSALLALSGCMTTDQPQTVYQEEGTNIVTLKKEMEKSNKKSIQYFMTKLKSVRQPQECLEFKSKRFSDISACLNWMVRIII